MSTFGLNTNKNTLAIWRSGRIKILRMQLEQPSDCLISCSIYKVLIQLSSKIRDQRDKRDSRDLRDLRDPAKNSGLGPGRKIKKIRDSGPGPGLEIEKSGIGD